MLEDKEMIGREDLLGICLPGHCSAIPLCVCVLIFGQLGAGVLDFSPGSISSTLILLSGRSCVVHSLWPAGIEITVLIQLFVY